MHHAQSLNKAIQVSTHVCHKNSYKTGKWWLFSLLLHKMESSHHHAIDKVWKQSSNVSANKKFWSPLELNRKHLSICLRLKVLNLINMQIEYLTLAIKTVPIVEIHTNYHKDKEQIHSLCLSNMQCRACSGWLYKQSTYTNQGDGKSWKSSLLQFPEALLCILVGPVLYLSPSILVGAHIQELNFFLMRNYLLGLSWSRVKV